MKKSLLALASGTLGLGIAEFVMMGILPNVARDLSISIPEAGHFISAYAIGVCVGAPLTVFVARTRPLKQIAGMTIANLFGVPLGTLLSNLFSWRFPFLFNGCWGMLVFFLVWKWIPVFPALPDVGWKGQFRFLRKLAPWLIILTTMFGNGGVFCWFSYVTPQMLHEAGFQPESLTWIMMLAGLGMTIGNLVGGRCGDLYGLAPVIQFTQVFMMLALLGTFLFAGVPWLSVLLMFICAAALFAVSPPQQLLLLQNSRRSEMMGAACVQIAFNLGNAVGAYAGGLPIDAGLGYRYPALVGVFVVALGWVCVTWYIRRERRHFINEPIRL